jgi:hypothetical protein
VSFPLPRFQERQRSFSLQFVEERRLSVRLHRRGLQRTCSASQRSQRTRSARRPGTGKDLQPPLTRLEQSGSGYRFHLIVPCLPNERRRFSAEISPRTASGGAMLCKSFHPQARRCCASLFILKRGDVVQVISSSGGAMLCMSFHFHVFSSLFIRLFIRKAGRGKNWPACSRPTHGESSPADEALAMKSDNTR